MELLKSIIVDDELNGIENLIQILSEYCPEVKVVGTAQTLDMTKHILANLEFDVAFLDVQIGSNRIFKILEELKEIDFEIVFFSAYGDHALEAFKYMAIDYLLKPIEIESLKNAILQVKQNRKKRSFHDHAQELLAALKVSRIEDSKIAIPTTCGYEFIYCKDILYCIAEGSYTCLYITNGKKIVASQTLKYYDHLLQKMNFKRIHNSHLVNLKYVKRISKSEGGWVLMEDGKTLSISKSRMKDLLNSLNVMQKNFKS